LRKFSILLTKGDRFFVTLFFFFASISSEQ
jgi:hypothetical protein